MPTVRCAALAIIFCAPALLAGCAIPGHGKPKVNDANPSAVAVIFVDVSKSTYGLKGAERRRYASYFASVVKHLPAGTLVKGDEIDKNPLSDSSLPVSGFIEKYGGLLGAKNKDDVDAANASMRAKLELRFRDLLQRRPTGNSILDALNIAQEVFDSYSGASTKYLVVFSDMIENSTRYRFTAAHLRPTSINAFIAQERKSGRLPDLHGVTVYVVGAGATRGGDAKAAHVRDVKAFWLSYVRATGADLPDYRYGPTLVRFP